MNYIARGAGSLYYLKFSRTGLIFIHFYVTMTSHLSVYIVF